MYKGSQGCSWCDRTHLLEQTWSFSSMQTQPQDSSTGPLSTSWPSPRAPRRKCVSAALHLGGCQLPNTHGLHQLQDSWSMVVLEKHPEGRLLFPPRMIKPERSGRKRQACRSPGLSLTNNPEVLISLKERMQSFLGHCSLLTVLGSERSHKVRSRAADRRLRALGSGPPSRESQFPHVSNETVESEDVKAPKSHSSV